MDEFKCYRDLIQNAKSPILFRDLLNWNLLTWSLEKWCSVFENEVFPFRCGKRLCQKNPVWENLCDTQQHTMNEFITFCSDQTATKNEFWYFDYKHIVEFFKDNIDLFRDVCWAKAGFPERNAENSTIWIGSEGAHTPCHIDSYGYNIVAQLYGRKRWLLFPPSETENLKPTRIPYEESSIYSSINFSCYENFKDIKLEKCYMVDLDPGDVLFVPARWWHYVENLSTAISINTWVPHKNDDHWKLEEALVRYFISTVVHSLPAEDREMILNPNEFDIEDNSFVLKVLSYCKHKVNLVEEDTPFHSTMEVHQDFFHIHKYKFIRTMSGEVMKESMKNISLCDQRKKVEVNSVMENRAPELHAVINAFCHPSIIAEVKNKLLPIDNTNPVMK